MGYGYNPCDVTSPLRAIAFCVLGCLVTLPALAAPTLDPDPGDDDGQTLRGVSIEDLSRIDVTSVSKHSEEIFDAPAAISVVTGDDIRRAGITELPEALRLATGVDVARFNGETWGISARGFNISTANKMLVLIDGRSIYTPLFSGVFWDVQDLVLDDIDRIEVIRGPGGALWGANAVNGVINIITKSAADTKGGLVVTSGGSRGGPGDGPIRRGLGLRRVSGLREVFGSSCGEILQRRERRGSDAPRPGGIPRRLDVPVEDDVHAPVGCVRCPQRPVGSPGYFGSRRQSARAVHAHRGVRIAASDTSVLRRHVSRCAPPVVRTPRYGRRGRAMPFQGVWPEWR